jgi:hypothetical protein
MQCTIDPESSLLSSWRFTSQPWSFSSSLLVYSTTPTPTCQVKYRLFAGYLHAQLVLLRVTFSVTNPDVAGVKICIATYLTTSLFGTYIVIPRLILGVVLCVLAIAQFAMQSIQMHKAIKQWRSDRYTKLFVRESILYFIAFVLPYYYYYYHKHN